MNSDIGKSPLCTCPRCGFQAGIPGLPCASCGNIVQRTHYPGCWRDPAHHECAVKLIERSEALIGRLELLLEFVVFQPPCGDENMAEIRQWLEDAEGRNND